LDEMGGSHELFALAGLNPWSSWEVTRTLKARTPDLDPARYSICMALFVVIITHGCSMTDESDIYKRDLFFPVNPSAWLTVLTKKPTPTLGYNEWTYQTHLLALFTHCKMNPVLTEYLCTCCLDSHLHFWSWIWNWKKGLSPPPFPSGNGLCW
jgi:hypothetical protein